MNPGDPKSTGKTPEETPTAPATDAPARSSAAPLSVVSQERYELQGEVGRGGLGRILSARDKRLGRQVAIKELLSSQGRGLQRFMREALLTARLEHPAIVPVHEAG